MKKLMCVFFTFAALLMLTAPAFAANAPIPDRGEPPASSSYEPVVRFALDDPSALPTPEQPEAEPAEPVDNSSIDAPVDEAACREETPGPYTPAQLFPGRGEITDILQYWEDNGYPDRVSYAFEAGGEVTDDGAIYTYWEIGLVDADETQKQEILDLVAPSCLVEFKNCLFTHAQKQAAYDTLTELAVTDPNIEEVIFIRNGDSVWVSVPEELTKEYAKYLIRDLGLGAVVSVTDQHSISYFQGGLENSVTTPGTGMDAASTPIPMPEAPGGASAIITGGESGLLPAAPETTRTSPVFWVCLAMAFVAACTLTTMALRRRFIQVTVTRDGTVQAGVPAPLTRRKTEQAVRESEASPDSTLYRTLLERIKEDPKQ